MTTDGSGGGARRPQRGQEQSLVAHEEHAHVDRRWDTVGAARVRRDVAIEKVAGEYPRRHEEVVHERVPVAENDSGEIETLADGSISVPLFEEELVVTKRTILRERVIIRKETVTEWEEVEAELRREKINVSGSVGTDQVGDAA